MEVELMAQSKKMKFEGKLEAGGEGDAWTFLKVPFNVKETFGTRGRVSVKGKLNGFPFRNSLFSDGNGSHLLTISKQLQAGAKAGPGATVRVEMEADTEPRTVELPTYFKKALDQDAEAKTGFEKLSYSAKKGYVDWIEQAKAEQTRAARLEKALPMIAAGKRLNQK
jgi:hypothetical protein